MKNILFVFFTTLLIFIFSLRSASADLINPEYYTKTCSSGEVEVRCSYRSNTPFGPKIYNECVKYEYNPSYRYLAEEGYSFGGSQKFCFKAASTSLIIGYHLKTLFPLVLITLLLEIPLFLIMIASNRKALLTILAANLISVPPLYFATVFLPFMGFIILILMELIVIVFEAGFIKSMLSGIGFRKVLIFSFIANIVSAVLGTLVFIIISDLLQI